MSFSPEGSPERYHVKLYGYSKRPRFCVEVCAATEGTLYDAYVGDDFIAAFFVACREADGNLVEVSYHLAPSFARLGP